MATGVTRTLTLDQARRVVVRAQGLDRRRSTSPLALLRRLGAVQIDSVNVLARAHYLPFFARLNGEQSDVDRLFTSPRTTEYWAHEASLIATQDRGLFAWRMRGWRDNAWGGPIRAASAYPGLLEMVKAEAPGTAREIEARLNVDFPRESGNWGWNWSVIKSLCEALFWAGELSTSGRNAQFERIYTASSVPDVDDEWAVEELAVRAVAAGGVATRRTVRYCFRIPPALTDLGIARALASGRIEEVQIDGKPWLTTPDLVVPRRDAGTALLGPFDSLLWDRRLVQALFDFEHTIELYTPAPKRKYGYYVLPFLLDGRLAARVDLKADRKARRLVVRSAWGEAAAPLAEELLRLAAWLGLDEVVVEPHGDLAASLHQWL